jgi:hypothetical protein
MDGSPTAYRTLEVFRVVSLDNEQSSFEVLIHVVVCNAYQAGGPMYSCRSQSPELSSASSSDWMARKCSPLH